jgi:excisionase family DNA binding protein
MAKIMGLGKCAAYQAVQRGEIPSLKFGKRIVIPRAALQKMLEGNGSNPAPGAK